MKVILWDVRADQEHPELVSWQTRANEDHCRKLERIPTHPPASSTKLKVFDPSKGEVLRKEPQEV